MILWNSTLFDLPTDYLTKYEIHNVVSFIHNELWIPARELDDFNKHIINKIEIANVFIGDQFELSSTNEASLFVLKLRDMRK